MVGAKTGDIHMALIVTTELHGGDPFAYLTALLTHAKDTAAHPDDWLPWNYTTALAPVAPARPPAAQTERPSGSTLEASSPRRSRPDALPSRRDSAAMRARAHIRRCRAICATLPKGHAGRSLVVNEDRGCQYSSDIYSDPMSACNGTLSYAFAGRRPALRRCRAFPRHTSPLRYSKACELEWLRAATRRPSVIFYTGKTIDISEIA